MQKFVCISCTYIYDPELGDIQNEVYSDTLFEDLPYDWVCPICGASKEEFDSIDDD